MIQHSDISTFNCVKNGCQQKKKMSTEESIIEKCLTYNIDNNKFKIGKIIHFHLLTKIRSSNFFKFG
jgi:hypothetical protein